MDIEEAKMRCNKIINDNNEVIREARKNGDINTMQLTASLDNDSIAIETVLNTMYKSIEEAAYYKDLVKLERKEKEQLKKSLKGQIKKKDLIINKMAKHMAGGNSITHATVEQIIEYFTNKAENVGE